MLQFREYSLIKNKIIKKKNVYLNAIFSYLGSCLHFVTNLPLLDPKYISKNLATYFFIQLSVMCNIYNTVCINVLEREYYREQLKY